MGLRGRSWIALGSRSLTHRLLSLSLSSESGQAEAIGTSFRNTLAAQTADARAKIVTLLVHFDKLSALLITSTTQRTGGMSNARSPEPRPHSFQRFRKFRQPPIRSEIRRFGICLRDCAAAGSSTAGVRPEFKCLVPSAVTPWFAIRLPRPFRTCAQSQG